VFKDKTCEVFDLSGIKLMPIKMKDKSFSTNMQNSCTTELGQIWHKKLIANAIDVLSSKGDAIAIDMQMTVKAVNLRLNSDIEAFPPKDFGHHGFDPGAMMNEGPFANNGNDNTSSYSLAEIWKFPQAINGGRRLGLRSPQFRHGPR